MKGTLTLFCIMALASITTGLKAVSKKTNSSLTKASVTAKFSSPGKDTNYTAGFILYDALALSLSATDQLTQKKILKYYEIQSKVVLDSNEFLKSEIDTNIFSNFSREALINPVKTTDKPTVIDDIGTITSAMGGIDVTTIADGFAKFIVKRTKQELSIAFFSKFKEQLNGFPDLKTVFPNTTTLLDVIDEQMYNYSNYISNLRDAFQSDIKTLDEHLPSIITNHDALFKQKNNFELALALRSGCYISAALKHNVHPGDLINGFPFSYFDSPPPEDSATLMALKGALQTLQLLSESVRNNKDDENYWVEISKIRELVNNRRALKIYLGLLIQQAHNKYNNINYNPSASFYTTLNKKEVAEQFNTNYEAYKQYLLAFGGKVTELNKMIENYEKPATDSLKVELYAKYVKTSVQLIDYCTQIGDLPYLTDITEIKNLYKNSRRYFGITYEVTDLATAINRKRYSEAINHLVIIYKDVINRPIHTKAALSAFNASNLSKKEYKKIFKSISTTFESNRSVPLDELVANDRYAKALTSNKNDSIKNSNHILSLLAKYGAFMADVATAGNSDDVEAAIEAAALPVGSSRIKRETDFSIALNTYCGLFTGHEDEKFSLKQGKGFNVYGVNAPIGLSFNWGHVIIPFFKTKYGASTSLFLSVFDLGAITAFRFVNDTARLTDKIQLKDLISPGIFYSFGIPKCPISVNIGYQLTPFYRQVNAGDDQLKMRYSRFSIAFCVDLPLLNVYVKSRAAD